MLAFLDKNSFAFHLLLLGTQIQPKGVVMETLISLDVQDELQCNHAGALFGVNERGKLIYYLILVKCWCK